MTRARTQYVNSVTHGRLQVYYSIADNVVRIIAEDGELLTLDMANARSLGAILMSLTDNREFKR
jgi:hypothetical protein